MNKEEIREYINAKRNPIPHCVDLTKYFIGRHKTLPIYLTPTFEQEFNSSMYKLNKLQEQNQALKKENKILRENAEHNDKVVDKVNWENQSLKKQLEEKENIACNWKDSCLENAGKMDKLENQQKEFIKYLEYQVKLQEELNDIHLATGFEEILSKYKEIIGDK